MPRLIKVRAKAEAFGVAHEPLISGRLNLTEFGETVRIMKIGDGSCDKLVRLSVGAVLQSVLLPFRNHPVERLLIEHAARVQSSFLLPTRECGGETAGRRVVLSIERLV